MDAKAIQDIATDILQHNSAQNEIISGLCALLKEGLSEVESENEWAEDVEKVLNALQKRRLDYENHRFNQKNGYNVRQNSPYAGPIGEAKIDIEVPGEEMSPEDIARHFNEAPKRKKKRNKKSKAMTLEEIEAWEKAQDNSNDIYKVSARIKNLARSSDASLTAVGDMLCNTYTHVAKSFYDFAETISDKETKIKLIELIKKNEIMPAQFIAAIKNGAR